MRKLIVLGAGRVGGAIVRDLARDPDNAVTAADSSPDALKRLEQVAAAEGATIRTLSVDLSNPTSLARALDGHELAVGAVPGPLGFETLRRVLQAGLDVVDISFFEEDALALQDLARRRGRTAIVDAGVAPGLNNLVLGHYEARLEEVTRFECLVGGIPANPAPPWYYKAPFSPIDVIAEYTRPARIRRGGEDVTVPALSEVEAVDFPGVGTLEAFNTDGLRTLLRTSRVPDLVEKTMRWPGHADRMRAMRDSGFFDEATLELPSGARIAPLELSARLLFEAWRYEEGEVDLTAMRMTVEGRDREGPVRHVLHLLDRYDPETGVSSMARTTGYTATALVRVLLEGRYREPGIAPPEVVGAEEGVLDLVLAHLGERGVVVERAEVRREAAEPAPTK
ncbi:MAG TPA: saccharopine dehydrogenase C-terminal domain-containing protein [Longimicrobiales bacterium]|nr:saccharopine dehydrogenase C-terminal domain-containing protein [Longimicrobiales bacterium]